jgi:hypothetical protein
MEWHDFRYLFRNGNGKAKGMQEKGQLWAVLFQARSKVFCSLNILTPKQRESISGFRLVIWR